MKFLKEKVLNATGSASGATSVLGSWQVCHNVCLGIVAILGVMGITLTGMPLLFLTSVAPYFWTVAFVLFLITIALYLKKKCISPNLLLLNGGLIFAGVPFQSVQGYATYFLVIGGTVALVGLLFFVREKIQGRKCHYENI